MPLSMLIEKVPPKLPTARNDGHVTAGQVLGEKRRDDYQAGWKIIVEEIVQILASQKFVGINDGVVRWLKPLDGVWTVKAAGIDRTIWGQRERRLGNDRMFLGERDEKTLNDLKEESGLMDQGRAKAIEVEVIGPRGASKFESFYVHPLALTIPAMSEVEREALREDILAHGVRMPLWLYPDGDDPDAHGKPRIKVLDGRNRLYIASVAKKPVRVEMFEGTEKEARDLVASLNLKRRHLTGPQRALAIARLYGEPARQKAAETRHETVGRPKKEDEKSRPNLVAISDPQKASQQERRWSGIAVSMAGGAASTGVTPAAITSIAKVMQLDAPATQAKVESGAIAKMVDAVREAEKEDAQRKGVPAPEPTYGQRYTESDRTMFGRLGQARKELLAILADLDLRIGGKAPDDVMLRISELEDLLSRIRAALLARGIK
jgi:hypothetical protein